MLPMLERAASFRHVRRLVIDGHMRNDDDHELDPGYQWQRPKMSDTERGVDDGAIDTPWDGPFHWHLRPDNLPAEAAYETNDAWRPLARLVGKLPVLADLLYRCPNQLSPCLLETVQQYQPHCRLHIYTFHLRSLPTPVIDAYELMLATSPNLYSIVVSYAECGGYDNGIPEYQPEAVMKLVTGLAPNLKQVHMYHRPPGHALYEVQPRTGFRLEKEGRSVPV
jgi:hypothetical protein